MSTELANLFNTLPADKLAQAARERVLSFPRINLSELIYAREGLPLKEFAVSLRKQHLIVFDYEGEITCPVFQFNEQGKPLSVVLRVNQMLGADEDPWGTASWWFFPNSRIRGQTPLALLEEDPSLLLELAREMLQ